MRLFRFRHMAVCAAALSALMFAAAAEAGPAGGNAAKTVQSRPLSGEWQVVSIQGKAAVKGIRGALPEVRFSTDGVSGQSGCNGFGSSVEQKGAKVKFGAPAATMMACPPPLMRQEQALFQALAAARSYKLAAAKPGGGKKGSAAQGRRLTFYNAKGQAVLALSAR